MIDHPTTALVTCYNKGHVIVNCVQALVDCNEIDSVIVFDDASTDQSVLLLQKSFLKNEKVKIITGTVNRGVTFSRNYLLEMARYGIIVFVDGDDVVNSVNKDLQIISFRRNFDKYLSYSDYERLSGSALKVVKSGYYSYDRLKTHNFIPFSSVLMRIDERVFFEAVHHEDYLFWLTYLKDKPSKSIEYFERNTFTYSVADNSLSSNIFMGVISNYRIKRRIGIGRIEALIRVFEYMFLVIVKRWI